MPVIVPMTSPWFPPHLVALAALLSGVIGCSSSKNLTLMPSPVLYQDGSVDPFAHLDEHHRRPLTHVFYATNRKPAPKGGKRHYSNRVDSSLHLGEAWVRMGEPDTDWQQLVDSSLAHPPLEAVPLTLDKVQQAVSMPITSDPQKLRKLTPEQRAYIDAINRELDRSQVREIMVYVHGTKVDFANAAILTAEVDHFAGRDFVGVAFAWPSHQNIFYYLAGVDVHRAVGSSDALQELLLLLAHHSKAERINLIAYSAGGKVATLALDGLRQKHPELSPARLRRKLRISSVVFAAIDVELHKLLDRLAGISEIAGQVVITVTDDDNALKAGKRFMGGEVRAGMVEAEQAEEDFIASHHLKNVEIIDISHGKEVRGFDITGHHYWYRHPWMSSDIVFLMRTNLPPHRRGLSPTELEGIWYLSPDYPEKVRASAAAELKGQW